MNTILLIIKREYLVRVRKRSFIVMTLLGPLLTFAFYAVIGWAAVSSINQKAVGVVDESGRFTDKLKNDKETSFRYLKESLPKAKQQLADEKFDVLVFIPKNVAEAPKTVQIFARKNVSLDLQGNIEDAISREIETYKLSQAGITRKVIEDAKTNVDAQTINLSDAGEKSSNSIVTTIIGGLFALLIYLSVFIYGAQVMRGVMEEKSNRIVEIIISSVKPFQLLMGKIVGVAMVGLTQFMLWIVLTVGLFSIGGAVLGTSAQPSAGTPASAQMQAMPGSAAVQKKMASSGGSFAAKAIEAIGTLNWPLVIFAFLIYFIGGYLLYSSLFGAIGAAVDNETDTQQFMLPVMLPLIAASAFAQIVIRDPDGPLAFWTSMIPLTSPVIMMVRIPFGVPAWEIALSMALLVLGFLGTIWLAARIYRVGILMYGKKPTYKELAKWVFYKA